MALEELTFGILGVKHYIIERYKGNVLIATDYVKITGQQYFMDKKKRLAYLIPPDSRCWIKGNKYRIMYDLNDAAPLNDLGDVLNPDLLKECCDQMNIPVKYRKFLFWSKQYTKDEIETEQSKWKLVPPSPIERVGLRPEPFLEWLESDTTGMILRKPEEKWGWLGPVFMAAVVGIMVILVAGFVTGAIRL